MNKSDVYAITKQLRKRWDKLDVQLVSESNPDELLVELVFTMRCLLDITELMLEDDENE